MNKIHVLILCHFYYLLMIPFLCELKNHTQKLLNLFPSYEPFLWFSFSNERNCTKVSALQLHCQQNFLPYQTFAIFSTVNVLNFLLRSSSIPKYIKLWNRAKLQKRSFWCQIWHHKNVQIVLWKFSNYYVLFCCCSLFCGEQSCESINF